MLIFIIIGIVGILIVLLSMLLGELIEFGDGVLSGTSLGVGSIVFGAVGVITSANGLSDVWAYVGSAVVAVVVMLVVQWFIKRLQATEDGKPISLVGVTGVATSAISPTSGEVYLDAPTELERRLAWSDVSITEGTRIVVVLQSGSRVKVTTPST